MKNFDTDRNGTGTAESAEKGGEMNRLFWSYEGMYPDDNGTYMAHGDALEAIKQAVAAEREACAKVIDAKRGNLHQRKDGKGILAYEAYPDALLRAVAAAIRQRGEK